MWNQSEMRQLTAAQFVEYLAWLSVAIRIVFLCLERAKHVQRATRKFRIDQDVLDRDDQAVASEWRDEPGKPGGRQKDDMIRALDWEAERGHVFKCAPKKAIELLIAGLNFCHGPQPIRQGFGVARGRMVFNAVMWRTRMLVVILQGIEKACMPGFSGVERNLKAETTVCIDGRLRKIIRGNYNRPAEVAVAIDRGKLLPCLRPFGGDPPSAYNVARFHLEEIREVATDGDLKLEFYRLHAVVGDVEIFMHATMDPSADGEAERARRNEANHIVACFRRFDRMFQGMGVIGIEEDRVVEFLAQGGDHGDNLADTDEVALALGSADQYWHFQSARGTRHRL